MNPPAPRLVSGLSAVNDAITAATAASTAFPPSRRTCAPASAVTWWPAATTPFMGGRVSARAVPSRPRSARAEGQRCGTNSGISKSDESSDPPPRRTRGSPVGSRNVVALERRVGRSP